MAATGKVHHNINTFAYGATGVANVVSVSWNQVGSQAVGLIDGAGNAAHYVVEPVAVQGVVVINSIVEAEKLASKVAAGTDATYNVKTDVDGSETVTIANIKTSAVLGGQNSLGGAGPYSVQFTADSVSNPT
jgi:hypothetical protein